jgi:hypothetical protein
MAAVGEVRVVGYCLDLVLGQVSESGHYENDPTHYRTDTPAQVGRLTGAFRLSEFINSSRVGQWSSYLARPLRGIARGSTIAPSGRCGPGRC